MRIKMPIVCGTHTHLNIYSKVDKAIAADDFPVELDCSGVVFTTSMFFRFIKTINTKVTDGGGSLILYNVAEHIADILDISDVSKIVEVRRA